MCVMSRSEKTVQKVTQEIIEIMSLNRFPILMMVKIYTTKLNIQIYPRAIHILVAKTELNSYLHLNFYHLVLLRKKDISVRNN